MLRLLLSTLAFAFCVSAHAQLERQRDAGERQGLPSQDTAARGEPIVTELPDTIIIARYEPRFPVAYELVPDSLLDLNYVRYDPVRAYGPDYVYLNTLGQPAALNPLLGTPYQRIRQPRQTEHPAYRAREAAAFAQNVPFFYGAYDQGGEINDGQVRVLFGRTFDKGWSLGLSYYRAYRGGERNRFPRSRAERINFGISLAYAPDSSRHRTYAWTDLNSATHDDSGGYFPTVSETDSIEFPASPFEAVPTYATMRTEGRFSSYHLLHRVFLREQLDPTPRGFAASVEASYRQATNRTFATAETDLEQLGPYDVDERGVRQAYGNSAILAEAYVEHFADPDDADAALGLDFRLGAYGGQQAFRADYLADGETELLLLGLAGRIRTQVLDQFTLAAEADLPFGERAGEGRVTGSLSWSPREDFDVAAQALLERSAAPLTAGVVGVNDAVIFRPDLPVATHTRFGGSARYLPLGLSARAYLDVWADATVYEADGSPRSISGELAIPTLELDLPVRLGWFNVDNRAVLRNPVRSSEVRLAGYSGQHAVYARTGLFGGAMELIAGAEAWVRSPAPQYDYFPLTGVFTLGRGGADTDWQYALDAFLAIKVQVFKAFIRADNLVLSDGQQGLSPSTVFGYPPVAGPTIGPVNAYLRFGVAFFLFN